MGFFRSASFIAYGLSSFSKKGYLKASKSFTPGALDVDLTDRVAIVTGANAGLGREVATELAQRKASVHLVCRNKDRGLEAQKEIIATTGNENVFLHIVDMARPAEVSKFAQEFARQGTLNLLVNNAGVLLNEHSTAPEGLETSFATNSVGTYVLTTELIEALKRGAQTPAGSRVVTVSSGGAYMESLNYKNFDSLDMKPFDGSAAYSRQKRHQITLTEIWAKDHAASGIHFSVCHPGWAETPGVRSSIPEFYEKLKSSFRTQSEGADTILWLSVSDEAVRKVPSGSFVFDRAVVSPHLSLGGTKYTPAQSSEFYDALKAVAQAAVNFK